MKLMHYDDMDMKIAFQFHKDDMLTCHCVMDTGTGKRWVGVYKGITHDEAKVGALRALAEDLATRQSRP